MKRALKILAAAYILLIGWHVFEMYRARWLHSLEPDVIRSS